MSKAIMDNDAEIEAIFVSIPRNLQNAEEKE